MPSVRSPRAGVVACLAGLALAAAVQVAAPLPGPPLYDGVVSVEPYVYLQPSGTQQGGALGASSSNAVVGGVSPAIVLGTPEQPPQAQLLAAAGSLALPGGTTRLVVSITPVPATVEPASGTIVGNVYRVLIVNQAGAPVTGLPDRQVTLALRDPGSTGLASIEHLTGGTWQSLPTVSAAVTGGYGGAWVSAGAAIDLPFSVDGLRARRRAGGRRRRLRPGGDSIGRWGSRGSLAVRDHHRGCARARARRRGFPLRAEPAPA